MGKWTETIKEYTIDEKGKETLTKVTREFSGFRKKEWVDFSLRIVALAAILTPILVFTLQQKREQQRQAKSRKDGGSLPWLPSHCWCPVSWLRHRLQRIPIS